jgi:hypothetical protein
MNPTGCLTQLIKPFLYLYCFLIVLFNIGMIALPILKLQMSPEDAKTGVFKFINEMRECKLNCVKLKNIG